MVRNIDYYTVRVSTESWFDGRSLNVKKRMTMLKRRSEGEGDPIKRACDMAGPDDAWPALMPDLHIKDGLYKLVVHRFFGQEYGECDYFDYYLEKIDDDA